MRFFPENIPDVLKDQRQWALWRRETRNGKPAKVPSQIDGKRGKSNDASTWSIFNTVLSAFQDLEGFDGICWMMPTEPGDVVFIDIDHCIKDGIIEPWAQKVIDEFASYTERSQSEEGLHILIKGKKPGKRCRKHGSPFEIYDRLRPCYLTGDVVEAHTTIESRQEPLDKLYNEIFPEANEPQQKARPRKSHSLASRLSLITHELDAEKYFA
jgi:putative DNA primase/helicase